MSKNILYWKWTDDLVEDQKYLDEEIDRLIGRCRFDLLYISLHNTLRYTTEAAAAKAAIAHAAGRLASVGTGVVLDIDIRQEYPAFIGQYPSAMAQSIRFFEGTLDKDGRAVVAAEKRLYGRQDKGGAKTAGRVLGAWCFDRAADGAYKAGTLSEIRASVADQSDATEAALYGGARNGAKRYVLALVYDMRSVDVLSPDIYPFYQGLIERYEDVPLAGAANDEWGLNLRLDCDRHRLYTVSEFPYSGSFEARFFREYGQSIKANLLALVYTEQGNEAETYAFVNRYTGLIRRIMVETNDWFYDAVKRVFGHDAFVGVHPTYWGDPYDFSMDILHNGLDWWEVKRDYAQTDEFCIMPVRLALMHKWGGKVAYNMWYSGGTQQLHTYAVNAWRDLRFGGRVHYLGWDCPNEGGVYNLRNPGSAEAAMAAEREIKRADAAIRSQPASDVLIIFGMEAVTNWRVNGGASRIVRGTGRAVNVLKFAQGVFSLCNCDLAPDTEITNGSVTFEGGKARYGTQHYSTVIYAEPRFICQATAQALSDFGASGGKLIVIGGDGNAHFHSLKRSAIAAFTEYPTAKRIKEIFDGSGTVSNRLPMGCVYQDKTVVFTADAALEANNYFSVLAEVQGHTVEFCGNDFLVLDLENARYECGADSSLKIDGTPQSNGKIGGFLP
ncbi:MAG: hypothetical protein LBH24_01100 [Clostridiales bacterium]|jgi:hypothetical protein|nr:hypothetical protein [Clostridiales bacterium]